MRNKLVGFLVVSLLAAVLIPVTISSMNEGQEPTVIDTHIAVEDVATPEIIQLENFPVVADSESITVNATPIAKPAEYTIVDATGVVTIAAASSVADDVIITTYNWTQLTGTIATIWVLLPLIVVVGVLFLVLRMTGMIGRKE